MALKSLVIEADASEADRAEDDINTAIATAGITPTQFIQAVTIGFQDSNKTAVVIIFYDDGT